jgi:hypothetical protein
MNKMLRDYLDLKIESNKILRLKITFVRDPILLVWLNGEGRWGKGICNSQKSYKLVYNVIKLQGDAY